MTAATRRAVFADLAALPERPTMEIIRGELVRKVSPSVEHGALEVTIAAWLGRRFNRPAGGRWPGGWWFATEVHVEHETHEVFCHDLVGWRRDVHGSRPGGWPCRVRPDWVCEILSPGHEKRDLVDKLWVLHAAGVPHYWVIDREGETLSIFRWEARGYLRLPPIGGDVTVRAEPFDVVELRTAILFDHAADED